jgi:hypothetical protein
MNCGVEVGIVAEIKVRNYFKFIVEQIGHTD